MVSRPIQFGQFLVCCSSTDGAPRAQPFIKVGARAPPHVPSSHGVGATAYVHELVCRHDSLHIYSSFELGFNRSPYVIAKT